MPENFEFELDEESWRMLAILAAVMCLIIGTFCLTRLIYDPQMQPTSDHPLLAGSAPTPLIRQEAVHE